MNGKCYPWDRVRKNRERGELEEIPWPRSQGERERITLRLRFFSPT
jgi:hypothetical protein